MGVTTAGLIHDTSWCDWIDVMLMAFGIKRRCRNAVMQRRRGQAWPAGHAIGRPFAERTLAADTAGFAGNGESDSRYEYERLTD